MSEFKDMTVEHFITTVKKVMSASDQMLQTINNIR